MWRRRKTARDLPESNPDLIFTLSGRQRARNVGKNIPRTIHSNPAVSGTVFTDRDRSSPENRLTFRASHAGYGFFRRKKIIFPAGEHSWLSIDRSLVTLRPRGRTRELFSWRSFRPPIHLYFLSGGALRFFASALSFGSSFVPRQTTGREAKRANRAYGARAIPLLHPPASLSLLSSLANAPR